MTAGFSKGSVFMNPNYGLASQPLHSPQGLAYLFGPNGQFTESDEPQVDEIRFRHLTTPLEIRQVLHLREELSLPAAIRDDPEFVAREKKETKSALSAHLSGEGRSLELFASFLSVRVSRLA
eukprot:gene5319-6787_t